MLLLLTIWRQPRSTRAYTLFPYTTLLRSQGVVRREAGGLMQKRGHVREGGGRGLHVAALWLSLLLLLLGRSEEHKSELQSLLRISYAVFCSSKNYNFHTIRMFHFYIACTTRLYLHMPQHTVQWRILM